MQAYLFVHFKEKTTPDGEQVYFGLSKDGFCWEEVNAGNPVLWCFYGEKGARDFTIVKNKHNEKYYIWGTDLALSYNFTEKYNGSWAEVSKHGSHHLSVWESKDLVQWSKQKLVKVGNDDFGCLWAPDIIYDPKEDDYILHWSSAHRSNGYGDKGIYYSRTRDFEHFTAPQELYRKKKGGNVIDSAIYEEDGVYYMFLKSESNPARIIMVKSNQITGTYERVLAFDESMAALESGQYEAPTAVKLESGEWCLFLDYYGEAGEKQGYVPFIAKSLASGQFVRADQKFSFPYGYKHGTILTISLEEYERIKNNKWS